MTETNGFEGWVVIELREPGRSSAATLRGSRSRLFWDFEDRSRPLRLRRLPTARLRQGQYLSERERNRGLKVP